MLDPFISKILNLTKNPEAGATPLPVDTNNSRAIRDVNMQETVFSIFFIVTGDFRA